MSHLNRGPIAPTRPSVRPGLSCSAPRFTHWSWLFATLPVLGLLSQTALGQPSLEELEEQAVRAAVERVSPAVLRIEAIGGREQVGGQLVASGPTTGVVVSPDGYVVSSAFNFVSQPASILVTLPDGQRAAATIEARDTARMLVLLKVNTETRLTPPATVSRDELLVGQRAIAIGRTFEGGEPSISTGVVSATNRIWGKAIQTDAKVSPGNYGGPLIDLQGRVMGILVPLSPNGATEQAGAEWYDSGIGFAAPLDELLKHLDAMKAGEDLKPGLLGVSLKGSDPYSDPALVAASQAKSPAYVAGIRAGDEIVEVDGQPIVRQAQLRHALGRHYAGEAVRMVVKRGDERLDVELELAGELEPYQHPFLGVLPLRNAGEALIVRYVYPGSPAEGAGLRAGDRLLAVGEQPLAGPDSLRQALNSVEPGGKLTIRFQGTEGEKTAEVTLGPLPTDAPGDLPAAVAQAPAAPAEKPATGELDVTIPEVANKCLALVPASYHPEVPASLLVWLHAPGKFDREAILDAFREACEASGTILLLPQAEDPARWTPGEVEFVSQAIDQIRDQYRIDPQRIAVGGAKAGGSLAYLTAFNHRNQVRAVVALDAAAPLRGKPPANDPVDRLAIYSLTPADSKLAPRIEQVLKGLEENKFPVTRGEAGGELLPGPQLETVLRWLDSLDRL